MLQRAASNAYSWWWASHIRTTQSKWLEITVVGKHPIYSPLSYDEFVLHIAQ
jgi:hypothetical protein